MEAPADNSGPRAPGGKLRPGDPKPARARRRADGPRAAVLDTLTIPGHPEQVAAARAFVVRTLSADHPDADADAAALLTSEIVTNAIQHSKSGTEGGTVTIVVIGLPHGILVEIIDGGSAGAPIVQGDLYAAQGHGLFLVQRLAAQWGYHRDSASTTVWFHLPAGGDQQQAVQQPGRDRDRPARADELLPGPEPDRTCAEPYRTGAEPHRARPAQRRAVAMRSAAPPA
jgi:anti-sigma regulatory factor (Ser/Thr protein kinase)